MLHGKKGFERVVWASKNVLNQSLTWLFYDFESAKDGATRPIGMSMYLHSEHTILSQLDKVFLEHNLTNHLFKDKHQPLWLTATPSSTTVSVAQVPILPPATNSTIASITPYKDEILLSELEEWISLTCLLSPRIQDKDTIDPFLCRYAVPDSGETDARDKCYNVEDLVRMRWYGFLPANVVRRIFTAAKKAGKERWFALQMHGFRGEALTVMKLRAEEMEETFLEWKHSARL